MSQLLALAYIDRLQPQFASFMGTFSQGAPPLAGMAASFVEIIPGIEISKVLDAVLKATRVRPGMMSMERHYGFLEFHASAQSEVKHALGVMLGKLNCSQEDREAPEILSAEIIKKVESHHAQMINITRQGSMLLAGQDIFIMECSPAGYACLAANEAEKNARVTLVDCTIVGAEGRLIMSGRSSDVARACQAAQTALLGIKGQKAGRRSW